MPTETSAAADYDFEPTTAQPARRGRDSIATDCLWCGQRITDTGSTPGWKHSRTGNPTCS